MNITTGWWASCVEDGLFIYKNDAETLVGKYIINGTGDLISVRNAAGNIAVLGNDHTVRFNTSGFVQLAKDTLVIPANNSYGVVACTSNFYTIINNATDFTIRQYSDMGVYTGLTWTITGQYDRNLGAVLNDSTFYWSNDDTIFAWDLNTDSALPDLVTLTGYRVSYIKATVDGRIAVIWINNLTNQPSTLIVYNTNGTIFASATYTGLDLISISLTIDSASGKFWVGRRDVGPYAFLLLLDYSAGDDFLVEQIIQVDAVNTNLPPSAEFGFYPLTAGSGEIGGLYKLTPDLKHDESWTSDVSYVQTKKPDPFIKTALFGDEA